MANRNNGIRNSAWVARPRDKALLLEVSADWIKLIEVTGDRRGRLTLTKIHIEPVDHKTVIAESLKHALKSGFNRMPVLASIPRQLVNVRLLELPSTDPVEIADMVELQIGRQTPYSVSEILSGHKILGTIRQATYTRVMLVIAQRSIVRERFYAMEAADLPVERLTVSSEGVFNWFLNRTREESPEKVLALFDVDSFFTHMIVVQHRKIVFTKSILWGASQAEEGFDGFVQQIRESIQACTESLHGETIASITLSGAGPRIDGLGETLAEATGLACTKADCLDDVKLKRGCGTPRDQRYTTASLTSLIGMALAPDQLDFDFVPDVVQLRRQLRNRSRMWAAMAATLATTMVCASLYGILSIGYRLHKRDKLMQQANAIKQQAVDVERMLEVIRATRERQNARFLPERLLPSIHRCLPKQVYIEELSIDAGNRQISMSGTAPSRKDIREFIRQLEESVFFVGVEEGGRTAMNQDERFSFQVTGRFEEAMQP